MNVAIIPARGGSKGIPRKNLALLNNRPLISYAIKAALESQLDAVYVSTEDSEIAGVAREWGARVIDRPIELASDTASSESVIIHALKELTGVKNVAFIQPTSPFLSSSIIDNVMEVFLDPRFDSVITGCPDYGYYGEIINSEFRPKRLLRQPRQEMTPLYRDNGALYYMPMEMALQGKRYGNRIGMVVMTIAQSIEIDMPMDLQICEMMFGVGR